LAWNYRIFFRCSFSRKGKLSSFGCPLRYLRHVTRLHESSVTLRIWVLCECTHPSMSNVKCVTLSACILYTRNMYTLSVRTRARSLKGTENTHTYTCTDTRKQTDRQTSTLHTNGQSCMCTNTHECCVVFVCHNDCCTHRLSSTSPKLTGGM